MSSKSKIAPELGKTALHGRYVKRREINMGIGIFHTRAIIRARPRVVKMKLDLPTIYCKLILYGRDTAV